MTLVKLNNHECFAKAFRKHAGQTLSTGQIGRILLNDYPSFSEGSVRPNDHAEGNECPCSCARTADRVFDRLRRGLYRVR
jgi:hypothetical protein